MPSLLDFLKSGSALGTDENFSDNETTATSLEDLFVQLCYKLDPSCQTTDVSFRIDSFDESAFGLIEQEDIFAEQVALATGRSNAKVCHMRHYSNGRAAHWHALFAQMDENGELERIIVTDSYLNGGHGITAQPDMQRNGFLQENRAKIQFIPGLQQPARTSTCWIYAVANLASLATRATVYERQQRSGTLGRELHSLLVPDVIKVLSSTNKVPTLRKQPKFFNSSERQQSISQYKNPDNSRSNFGGFSLLFIGATAAGFGALILPLGFAVGISLLTTGLLMLLVGAALLTRNYLINSANEKIDLSYSPN